MVQPSFATPNDFNSEQLVFQLTEEMAYAASYGSTTDRLGGLTVWCWVTKATGSRKERGVLVRKATMFELDHLGPVRYRRRDYEPAVAREAFIRTLDLDCTDDDAPDRRLDVLSLLGYWNRSQEWWRKGKEWEFLYILAAIMVDRF